MIHLVLALLLVLGLVYWQNKTIKDQLSYYLELDKTNLLVRVWARLLGYEGLVDSINKLIESTRKSREEVYRKSQSLKGQVISISHNLKTPLSSILGYISLIEEGGDPDGAYLQVIKAKALDLDRVVQDFHEISLVEEPNFNLEEEPDLASIFEKFYTGDYSRKAPATGIGLYTAKALANKMGIEMEGEFDGDWLTIRLIYGK